jgi:hypothetical protein
VDPPGAFAKIIALAAFSVLVAGSRNRQGYMMHAALFRDDLSPASGGVYTCAVFDTEDRCTLKAANIIARRRRD